MITETEFKIGDAVGVEGTKYPGAWTITKINQRTFDLTGVTGKKLRCDKEMVFPYDSVAMTNGGTAGLVPLPPTRTLPHLPAGSFVRFVGRTDGKLMNGQILVVLVDKFDKINCTKVGGADDRYWRFPPRALEVLASRSSRDALTGAD